MRANNTNPGGKIIFKELSYVLTGICFDIHNSLGRFAREKQYCDALEQKLKEAEILYKRELPIDSTGNRVDFLIEDKIILEIKAREFFIKDNYYQLQRYLQSSGIKLGLIINFRNRYLKPIRVIRLDTVAKGKYL